VGNGGKGGDGDKRDLGLSSEILYLYGMVAAVVSMITTTWFLLALDQLYTYHMFEMEPIRIWREDAPTMKCLCSKS